MAITEKSWVWQQKYRTEKSAFYRFVKKDDLVRPMLTGYKKIVSGVTMPTLKFQPIWLALIMLAIAFGIVYYVVAVMGAQ